MALRPVAFSPSGALLLAPMTQTAAVKAGKGKSMSTETTPENTPEAAPAATPAPAPEPASEPASQPFAVFGSSEEFQGRLDQAKRSFLKEHGLESPEQLAQLIEAQKAAEAKAEEDRRAQMSELEQEREARAKYEAQAQEAMDAKEEAELRAHIYMVCAEKGIKNHDYAFYALTNKLTSMSEDEELDEGVFFDELMADPQGAAALGMPQQVRAQGASTTIDDKGPAPTPAGGGEPEVRDANKMSKAEFSKYLAGLGVHTSSVPGT